MSSETAEKRLHVAKKEPFGKMSEKPRYFKAGGAVKILKKNLMAKRRPPSCRKKRNQTGDLPPGVSRKGEILARDGTNRGGRRPGAGNKPAPAYEKIQSGKRVMVMDNELPTFEPDELEAIDLPDGAAMDGNDMPRPSDYLSARQKNGEPLGADAIYRETWKWLKRRHCENLVNPRQIETYAQAFARYIQCEEAMSTYGLLGKHPTTGGVMESPFVKMSQQFQKAASLAWMDISAIVRDNCATEYSDDFNDSMEMLLRSRRNR